MERTVIRIAGQSGSGLVATGEIFIKALKTLGFHIYSDREYPSLIKGGHATFQIDFSPDEIRSNSTEVDVIMCVDRVGLHSYLETVKDGGIVIHGDERHEHVPGLLDKAKAKKVQLVYMPERKTVYENGGNLLMTNMIMLGLTWRVMGFPLEVLTDQIRHKFAAKPKLLEIDLKLVEVGYAAEGVEPLPQLDIDLPEPHGEDYMLINGNEAIALGAIHAGVRVYYAYPMSPSSSILTVMANATAKTGMVVKQAEDEITAAQMAIGSMHMGTRALVGTSGGGFALMTETVSLSGMIEVPLVIIIVQRPGPATGLPTWTTQGDLYLAMHAGHGEFPRIVIGCSDPESCFELIQQAMNMADKYQTFVAVLSEKVIAEARVTVAPFPQNTVPIERGLVLDEAELKALKSTDRYGITESGISKRWIPGRSEAAFCANSDEHLEDGSLTEDAGPSKAMFDKRLRKMDAIKRDLPKPQLFGPAEGADISFIGWGSTKNVMRDVIAHCEAADVKINYLHYDYLWPLDEGSAVRFFETNPNVNLLEGNATAQFGLLVEEKTGKKFNEKFLKYDGRPFFFDEVLHFIDRKIGLPLNFK